MRALRLVTVVGIALILKDAWADDIPTLPSPWEWSLSTSYTFPYANEDAPANGVRKLYLWMTNNQSEDIQWAEFQLFTTGEIAVRSVTGANGVAVHGDSDALAFVVESGTCFTLRKVVAILEIDDHGGQVCTSQLPWSTCSAACADGQVYQSSFRGFSSTGEPACNRRILRAGVLCSEPPSDDSRTWGLLKVTYK
jgi:hypothetical protein